MNLFARFRHWFSSRPRSSSINVTIPESFRVGAQTHKVPDNEIAFRYAAYEAMCLAMSGNQRAAETKLKEADLLYSTLGHK